MPQYVVHKIGFLYNDNFFEPGETKGPVMGISTSLEEAKMFKNLEDIDTIQQMGGHTIRNFLRQNPNYETILLKLTEFYKTYRIAFEEGEPCVPSNMYDELAAEFLSITELSFHNIVEYSDEDVIHPDAFSSQNKEYYWR
jgi:hypothetical protein